MSKKKGADRAFQIWEMWVSENKTNKLERRKELRQMAMEIENELDEIENSNNDLEEENRCGQLAHGTDGKWVSMDKEDGSLTYPVKPGCNSGKQYKRVGRKPGKEMTPCGRRHSKRKCKG